MTETGLSLGTPHYMSPEQASADRDLSARSDVYSLGCVLYEMIAGQPPHTGPSAQSVLVRILTESPRPLTELRHTVPPHVAATVTKALEKLPADRFETANAFLEALGDEAFTYEPKAFTKAATPAAAPPDAAPARRPTWQSVLPWAVAGVLAITAGVAWLQPDPPTLVQRFPLALDDLGYGAGPAFAISPDGSTIAYIGRDQRLYWRAISSLEAQVVPGSEQSRSPFFSRDGRTIGYTIGPADDDRIRTMSLDGAPPRTLAPDHFPGGTWGYDGFVYYVDLAGGLWRVSEQGGDPELVAEASDDFQFRWPDALPGGRALLLAARGGTVSTFDLESREVTPLLAASIARYAGRHIFWVDTEGTLSAAPFDPRTLELTGAGATERPSVPANVDAALARSLEKLPADRFASAQDFVEALSDAGFRHGEIGTAAAATPWNRVAVTGWATAAGMATLAVVFAVAFTRSSGVGARSDVVAAVPDYRPITATGDAWNVSISPDGETVTDLTSEGLVTQDLSGGDPILIYEDTLWSRLLTRFGEPRGEPRWLPDGSGVAFTAAADSTTLGVYTVPRMGGDAQLRQLAVFEAGEIWAAAHPMSEGAFLLARVLENERARPWLRIVSREGEEVIPVPDEIVDLWDAVASPDGRWIAFLGERADRTTVLATLPRDGGQLRVIVEGGADLSKWAEMSVNRQWAMHGIIRWREGRLYYRRLSDRGMDLYAVGVDLSSGERTGGDPQLVLSGLPFGGSFDVSADGKRIVYSGGVIRTQIKVYDLTSGTGDSAGRRTNPDSWNGPARRSTDIT